MWFKNLLLYRLTKPLTLESTAFSNQLADNRFTPCGSQDIARYGFVNPVTRREDGELTHQADGNWLLCVRQEEKLLPGGVIKELLDEKVAEIQQAQGRAVGRKEKQTIKEEIVTDLLPRAFVRSRFTYAYISEKLNLVIVDTSSAARAEEVLGLLRKSIGSLPVTPLAAATPVAVTLTDWLKTQAPAPFEVDDEAEFKSLLEEGGVIRTKKQALNMDEINTILDNQRLVSKLAISYPDNLSFVLDENLAIKRVKFADLLREENDDIDGADKAARLDADFVLMARTFEVFIPELINALGGEAEALA
ncbi:recombination-associated protein RdgC [Gallaecimonas xiamenensis]|uniref:Recombination-associated protein RdgC n=1 Tax=Gallaecimonas xiamenensis 3-C-1 TaxID=745411 RepID=K2IEQ9_9GAMM|nr:recombination-associated protein RdgC [Gallaecimonas xiamenensis]EKE68511.1 recombination associated protein [Gallaecimonas xiamenensis 3-C-1]